MSVHLNSVMIETLATAFNKTGWTFNTLLLLASEEGASCARGALQSESAILEQAVLRIKLSAQPKTGYEYRDIIFHTPITDEHAFIWCDETVGLYDPLQDEETTLEANVVIKRINASGYPPLNANVLDVVLERPHLIPQNWYETTGRIYFYGTRFKSQQGEEVVRYMYKDEGKWVSGVEKLSASLQKGDLIAYEIVV